MSNQYDVDIMATTIEGYPRNIKQCDLKGEAIRFDLLSLAQRIAEKKRFEYYVQIYSPNAFSVFSKNTGEYLGAVWRNSSGFVIENPRIAASMNRKDVIQTRSESRAATVIYKFFYPKTSSEIHEDMRHNILWKAEAAARDLYRRYTRKIEVKFSVSPNRLEQVLTDVLPEGVSFEDCMDAAIEKADAISQLDAWRVAQSVMQMSEQDIYNIAKASVLLIRKTDSDYIVASPNIKDELLRVKELGGGERIRLTNDTFTTCNADVRVKFGMLQMMPHDGMFVADTGYRLDNNNFLVVVNNG